MLKEKGIGKMKWIKTILCIALAILLPVITGCSKVSVGENPFCKVVYQYDNISFSDELTAEEVSAVAQILDGKVKTQYLLSTPSCGFDNNIAIVINGTHYALACDKCATLKVCGAANTYIEITQEERDILEAIFTARGGKFPCV